MLIYLEVDKKDNGYVKHLGAKFNHSIKKWFIHKNKLCLQLREFLQPKDLHHIATYIAMGKIILKFLRRCHYIIQKAVIIQTAARGYFCRKVLVEIHNQMVDVGKKITIEREMVSKQLHYFTIPVFDVEVSTCIVCLKEKLNREMVSSTKCHDTCKKFVCKSCWRNALFLMKKRGLHNYSEKMLSCHSCSTPYVVKDDTLPDIFKLAFKYLSKISSVIFSITNEIEYVTDISKIMFSYVLKRMKCDPMASNFVWYAGIIVPSELVDKRFKNDYGIIFFDGDKRIYSAEHIMHQSKISQYKVDITSITAIISEIHKYTYRSCKNCSSFEVIGRKENICGIDEEKEFLCVKCDSTCEDIRNCPSCGVYCTRYDGCNFMTCYACSKKWCYFCNQTIRRGIAGELNHYIVNSFGKCKGVLDASL